VKGGRLCRIQPPPVWGDPPSHSRRGPLQQAIGIRRFWRTLRPGRRPAHECGRRDQPFEDVDGHVMVVHARNLSLSAPEGRIESNPADYTGEAPQQLY